MRFNVLLSVLFCFLLFQSKGQTTYKNREYSLATENDVYLLQDSDRYYSNGIIFHKRWVPGGHKSNKDTLKSIYDFEFSHKTYTAQDLLFRDFDSFDRPYAGLMTFGLSQQRFSSPSFSRTIGVETALIGDISGAQLFQEWYHDKLGFKTPRGWKFQIPNEFLVNLKASIAKQLWILPKKLDLVLDSEAYLGTGFTHFTQRIDFRFGKLQHLENSSFKNASIGKGSDKATAYNYFFFGYGTQIVLHNIVIEGSLFHDRAPHTEEALTNFRHWRIGWATNSHNTTFKMVYNGLSPEVEGNKVHGYITFELAIRLAPKNPFGE